MSDDRSQMLKEWLILNSKVAPKIFNSITSVCGRNLHKIWMKLKTNFATASIYGIYRVWQGYQRVRYENDLL